MDRCLHWLRYREAQGQFRYYWASGNLNWGDYSTKHHPPYITNPEEYNYQDIQERTSNLSKVQQGCIVPSARWNLLPPGTLTRCAYTAT